MICGGSVLPTALGVSDERRLARDDATLGKQRWTARVEALARVGRVESANIVGLRAA